MADVITANVDSTRLISALRLAATHTRGTVEMLVKYTAFYVAVKTQSATPFVTQQTIDAELGTIVTPRLGKRGQELSQKYAKNKIYSSGRRVPTTRGNTVPLAAMIIQSQVVRPDVARSTPSAKRFNRLTHFRFARVSSPFRGLSRSAGRAAMRAAVDRLIKARHSSTHFLAAGWVVVLKKLNAQLHGLPPMDSEVRRAGRNSNDALGQITVEPIPGKFTITIENMVGMAGGKKGDNSASYNAALMLHGTPALQAALDSQADYLTGRYAHRALKDRVADPFNAMSR